MTVEFAVVEYGHGRKTDIAAERHAVAYAHHYAVVSMFFAVDLDGKAVGIELSQTVHERNKIGNLIRLARHEFENLNVQTRAANVKTTLAVHVYIIDIARFPAKHVLERADRVERAARGAYEVVAATGRDKPERSVFHIGNSVQDLVKSSVAAECHDLAAVLRKRSREFGRVTGLVRYVQRIGDIFREAVFRHFANVFHSPTLAAF